MKGPKELELERGGTRIKGGRHVHSKEGIRRE